MINVVFPNIIITSDVSLCKSGIQYHFFLCKNYQFDSKKEEKYNVYFYEKSIYASEIIDIKRHVYSFQINDNSFINFEKNNKGIINMMFIPIKTNWNNYLFHVDIKDEFMLQLIIECMANYLHIEDENRQAFAIYIKRCFDFVNVH